MPLTLFAALFSLAWIRSFCCVLRLSSSFRNLDLWSLVLNLLRWPSALLIFLSSNIPNHICTEDKNSRAIIYRQQNNWYDFQVASNFSQQKNHLVLNVARYWLLVHFIAETICLLNFFIPCWWNLISFKSKRILK